MKNFRGAHLLIVFLSLFVFFIAAAAFAAETRGLTVVAKDSFTQQLGEVKLYNRSYAVVIGIDQYLNLPRDRQLKNAVKDAQGVAEVLRKHYRFDRIFELYNREATKDRILELLTEELPRGMGSDDAVFIFWAGHGNQEESAEGEIGYLIPFDGAADRIRKNITMTEIRDTVSRKLPAKHVFYAFDACYSGLLTTRAIDRKVGRDLSYLKAITRERVRQVLTAGGKGEEVLDSGPRGYSVFTGRLIEALEARGDFITANEIQAILREKVYGDAVGRGKAQTPSFGTLSGSGGDFVFVPIEQRADDGAAELERIAKERQALERRIAEMNKSRDADQQRQAKEEAEKLKALQELEKTKQAQLAREREEAEKLKQSQDAFALKLRQQQEEMARKKRDEEARLNELKKIVAADPAGATGSLDAAVAEIKRLAAEIEALDLRFSTERTEAARRIGERYEQALTDVRRQREAEAAAPLVKGEFEKEAAFRERQNKRFALFNSRIAELEQQKREELSQARQDLDRTQAECTAGLRTSMEQLSQTEYTVDVANLTLNLGAYDAEREQFPVTLTGRAGNAGMLDIRGMVAVAIDKAPDFKGFWQKGIIRPDVRVRAGSGKITYIALTNTGVATDADDRLRIYNNGEFITLAENKRRTAETARRKAEQERKREELRRTLGGLDIEMVTVPGGCFQMGDTFGDGGSDEKPVHEVCVSDFSMGKTEVTQGQWQAIMWNNPSNFKNCGSTCPVENVSWNDAQDFVRKLNTMSGMNFRLPTEAEWEYAARSGGKREKYSGNDSPDSVGWYSSNSGSTTHAVGAKSPNGLELYDMTGNVWEWCQDWYGEKYYSESPRNNPQGPSTGSYRMVRGGGWDYDARIVRVANRSWNSPDNRLGYLGFRLVSPVQ